MDHIAPHTIQITCAAHQVPQLTHEVEALGYSIENAHATGVQLAASLYDCMALNLHLRTAYNVMLLLGEFEARDPDQLYQRCGSIAWETIIPPDGYISIVARVDNPTIDNTMFAALRVKDAIVDRMTARTGQRPDSGKSRDRLVFHLYWKGDQAWLYLNTSGAKLSDRGYRKLPWKAPLRESLAAAMILETGYDGSVPFVNPMCGSGTLAIEAALIAASRAPGLLRGNFGFMHVRDFDNDRWQGLRAAARKQSRKTGAGDIKPIIASDINKDAVAAARQNARTAGVEQMIDFHVCDFRDTPLPGPPGIVMLNPEYGARMGNPQQLKDTYAYIGDYFKQECAGYTGYIFTGNLALAKCVGLRTRRRIPFLNGNIESRLLEYDLYAGTRKQKDGGE